MTEIPMAQKIVNTAITMLLDALQSEKMKGIDGEVDYNGKRYKIDISEVLPSDEQAKLDTFMQFLVDNHDVLEKALNADGFQFTDEAKAEIAKRLKEGQDAAKFFRGES